METVTQPNKVTAMTLADLRSLAVQIDHAWQLDGASFAKSLDHVLIVPKSPEKPIRVRASFPLPKDRSDRTAHLARLVWFFARMELRLQAITAGGAISTLWNMTTPSFDTDVVNMADRFAAKVAHVVRHNNR